MKKILIPILGIIALCTVMAFADESNAETPTAQGSCGTGLTWEWYENTSTLIIGGTGTTMRDYSSSGMPWYNYITSITTVLFDTPNLTNIGDYAFYGATHITKYDLPTNLKTFGRECFENNTSLPSHFVIPNSVNSIGRDSFKGCTQITKLTMPVYCEVSGFGPGFTSSQLTELVLKPSDSDSSYSSNDWWRIQYLARNSLNKITLDGVDVLPANTFQSCYVSNINARFYADEDRSVELSMIEVYSTVGTKIYVGYDNITAQGIDADRNITYYIDGNGKMDVNIPGTQVADTSMKLWTISKQDIVTINIISDTVTRFDSGNLFKNLPNCTDIIFDTPALTTTNYLDIQNDAKLVNLKLPINMSSISSNNISNLSSLEVLDINMAGLGSGSLPNCNNLHTLIINQDNNRQSYTNANITKIIIKKGTGNTTISAGPIRSLYSGLTSIQFMDDVTVINAGLFTNTGIAKVEWPTGWLGNYTTSEFTVSSSDWTIKLYMAIIKSTDVDLNIDNETLNYGNVDSTMDVSGNEYSLVRKFMVYPTDYETGTDTGIAGMVLTFVPIFVLLAILGSVAYWFVNKSESE